MIEFDPIHLDVAFFRITKIIALNVRVFFVREYPYMIKDVRKICLHVSAYDYVGLLQATIRDRVHILRNQLGGGRGFQMIMLYVIVTNTTKLDYEGGFIIGQNLITLYCICEQ